MFAHLCESVYSFQNKAGSYQISAVIIMIYHKVQVNIPKKYIQNKIIWFIPRLNVLHPITRESWGYSSVVEHFLQVLNSNSIPSTTKKKKTKTKQNKKTEQPSLSSNEN
jgi:hypothetical protein